MIKKIFFGIVVILLICFSVRFDLKGSEIQRKESKDYLWIEDNFVQIEVNMDAKKIIVENEKFYINSYFENYKLLCSAICQNLILFQCDEQKVLHLSIDIEKNILRYMIEDNNRIYCSEIKISDIVFSDEEIKNNNLYQFLDIVEISYKHDFEKYKYFEKSAYDAYICFEDLFSKDKEVNNSSKNNTYVFNGKNEEEIEIGYEMINEIFSSSLLSDPGLHYGTVNNNNGIKYIYIVDTGLYIGNKYMSKIKVWEISFDYTPMIYSSLDVNVDLDIIKLYDAFIEGSSTEGKITLAEEGYTYVPMKSICSKISVSNYSYISKYKIGYKNEEVTIPSYINLGNKILGMFAPYYKKITSITNWVDNIADYMNQSHFDEQLKEYSFISSEYNLKEVGFQVLNSDLGVGIFNDEYLYNYSFYQDITISKVPNYLIEVNAEIQIVLLYGENEILNFNSNIDVINNYNCNHLNIYENDNNDVHMVKCNYCLYSYFDSHEKNYVNQENLGHNICCEFCDYSELEAHDLKVVTNGNKCYKCGYNENTIQSYVSNNDGKTHTIFSGTISKREFCLGMVGDIGDSCCIKCGQILD